jgi:hypothetical protein
MFGCGIIRWVDSYLNIRGDEVFSECVVLLCSFFCVRIDCDIFRALLLNRFMLLFSISLPAISHSQALSRFPPSLTCYVLFLFLYLDVFSQLRVFIWFLFSTQTEFD